MNEVFSTLYKCYSFFFFIKESTLHEQREIFLFGNMVLHYFDLKIPPLKTHKILFKCYKDDSPSVRTIKYWYFRFNDCDFFLTEKLRVGKPQKISDKEIIKKVKKNPTITQRENTTHFNVSQPAISQRLKQIGFIQK